MLSPWLRNSVRRRWAHIAFTLILLFDAALLFVDLDYYRFGPRERAGLYTFLEMARDAGELAAVPEMRFVSDEVAAV